MYEVQRETKKKDRPKKSDITPKWLGKVDLVLRPSLPQGRQRKPIIKTPRSQLSFVLHFNEKKNILQVVASLDLFIKNRLATRLPFSDCEQRLSR